MYILLFFNIVYEVIGSNFSNFDLELLVSLRIGVQPAKSPYYYSREQNAINSLNTESQNG